MPNTHGPADTLRAARKLLTGRNRRTRRRYLAALTLALLVAGCGSSSGSGGSGSNSGGSSSSGASSGKTAATKVTIAYTAPIADQMLASVAQSAGLFKKNGIDANIKFLQASLALPALVSGQVQFVVVGAPSAEVASLNGTPVEYIGQWENVIDAEIAANKSVASVKDMSGKTIAISSSGALSDFLVQIADEKYGVQMHEVPLGQLPNELAAYSKGTVQAISGVNPWQLPSLEKQVPGTHAIVNYTAQQGYPGVGAVVDANWVKKSSQNASTAVKVLRALYQGISYYKTHASAAISVIAKNTGETAAEAKAAYDATKPLFTSSIVPTLADQKNVLKQLAASQPNAKTFPASKLMDASYAKQAEKK